MMKILFTDICNKPTERIIDFRLFNEAVQTAEV